MDNIENISQYDAFARKGDPFFLWIENTSAQNQSITLFDYNASAASSSSSANTVVDSVIVGDGPVSLAYNSTDNTMYVLNFTAGTITIVDCSTGAVTSTIASVGTFPVGIAFDSTNNRIYANNQSGGNVRAIDCATNTIIATITVGSTPRSIAFDSANARMYVGNRLSDNVSVIVCSSNTVLTTITVGDAPGGVAYDSANGRMYVANENSDNVSVINCTTNTVISTITVGNFPSSLAYDSANGRMYVNNVLDGTVSVIDCDSNTVIATVTITGSTSLGGISYNSNNSTMYVADVTGITIAVIDCATNTVTATITVAAAPGAVAFASTEEQMYVTSLAVDTVYFISVGSPVSITSASGTTYTSLCANLIGNNAWIKRFDIQAETAGQLNQSFSISLTDQMTGNALTWALVPRTPPTQKIAALNDVETKHPIVLDGFTTMSTTILAGAKVLYLFWFVELGGMTLAEKHILKENIEAVKEQIKEQNEFRTEKWLCEDMKDVYLYYNDTGHLPCNDKKQAA